MKSLYCLVHLAILLVSCSSAPSVNAVQTAIAQTQITQHTSTTMPTAIPTPTVSKPSISETC
jgi:PBP1b-binding outer membrane lipoprotein LpoB